MWVRVRGKMWVNLSYENLLIPNYALFQDLSNGIVVFDFDWTFRKLRAKRW